jgi:hypothetical protein
MSDLPSIEDLLKKKMPPAAKTSVVSPSQKTISPPTQTETTSELEEKMQEVRLKEKEDEARQISNAFILD